MAENTSKETIENKSEKDEQAIFSDGNSSQDNSIPNDINGVGGVKEDDVDTGKEEKAQLENELDQQEVELEEAQSNDNADPESALAIHELNARAEFRDVERTSGFDSIGIGERGSAHILTKENETPLQQREEDAAPETVAIEPEVEPSDRVVANARSLISEKELDDNFHPSELLPLLEENLLEIDSKFYEFNVAVNNLQEALSDNATPEATIEELASIVVNKLISIRDNELVDFTNTLRDIITENEPSPLSDPRLEQANEELISLIEDVLEDINIFFDNQQFDELANTASGISAFSGSLSDIYAVVDNILGGLNVQSLDLEIKQDNPILIPVDLDIQIIDSESAEYISSVIVKGFALNGLDLVSPGQITPDGNTSSTVRLSHVEEINGEQVPVWIITATAENPEPWNDLGLFGPSPKHRADDMNLQIEVVTQSPGSDNSQITILQHQVLIEPVTDYVKLDTEGNPDLKRQIGELCEDEFTLVSLSSFLKFTDHDGSEISAPLSITLDFSPRDDYGTSVKYFNSGVETIWTATPDDPMLEIHFAEGDERSFSIRPPENSNELVWGEFSITFQDSYLSLEDGSRIANGETRTYTSELFFFGFSVRGAADAFENLPHPPGVTLYSDDDNDGSIILTQFTPVTTADTDGSEKIYYLFANTVENTIFTSPVEGEDPGIANKVGIPLTPIFAAALDIEIGTIGLPGELWLLTQEEVANGIHLTNLGEGLTAGESGVVGTISMIPFVVEDDIDLVELNQFLNVEGIPFINVEGDPPKGFNILFDQDEIAQLGITNLAAGNGEVIEAATPEFIPQILFPDFVIPEDDGERIPFTLINIAGGEDDLNAFEEGGLLEDYPYPENLSVVILIPPGGGSIQLPNYDNLEKAQKALVFNPVNNAYTINVAALQDYLSDFQDPSQFVFYFISGKNQAFTTLPDVLGENPPNLFMKTVTILERGDGNTSTVISDDVPVKIIPVTDVPEIEATVNDGAEGNLLEDEEVALRIEVNLTDRDLSEIFVNIGPLLTGDELSLQNDDDEEAVNGEILVITPLGVHLTEIEGEVAKIGSNIEIAGQTYIGEVYIVNGTGDGGLLSPTLTADVTLRPNENGHGEIPITIGAFPLEISELFLADGSINTALLNEEILNNEEFFSVETHFITKVIDIHAVADKPLLDGSSVNQDIAQPILIEPDSGFVFSEFFPVTLIDTDGSESVAVRIDNLADFMLDSNPFRNGAGVNIGTLDPINNSYVFTLEEYQQLVLDPPDGLSGLIAEDLRITVTTRENSNGDAAETELTFDLRIENPILSVPGNINLDEDSYRTPAVIASNIVGLSFLDVMIPINGIVINDASKLTDFTVTIDNLPDAGASLMSLNPFTAGDLWGSYDASSKTWTAEFGPGSPSIDDQLNNLQFDLDSEAFSLFQPEPITLVVNATTTDGIERKSFTITSTGSNDTLIGTDGSDNFDAGSEPILGGDGNDMLSGGPGDDFIAGGEGNDMLFGNSGDDLLYGGPGHNTLSGGEGSDIFLFDPYDFIVNEAGLSNTSNRITDFELAAGDNIMISIRDELNFDPDSPELYFEFTTSSDPMTGITNTNLTYHLDGDAGLNGNSVTMATFVNASFSLNDLQENNQIQFLVSVDS